MAGGAVHAAQQPADDARSPRCCVFPKLALGLSGFETGVAVMPLVKGEPARPDGDIRRGASRTPRSCSRTAALIMSVLLIGSSIVDDAADSAGGIPEGRRGVGPRARVSRAQHLGEVFGTIYDLSTISILWFAGASAMAGLLNLVPQISAPLRHGAGMDQGDAAAGAALHGHHVPHHDVCSAPTSTRRAAPTPPACWC